MGREALAFAEGKLGAVLAQDRTLPLLSALSGLFPEGALRRGSTVLVGQGAFPGATSLALLLLAGPSSAGSWCAVVGAPDLGLVAAGQAGAQLDHLALVPSPGRQWPVVTAALLEGFDMVLLQPPGTVSPSDARKLEARARERGSVLAVLSGRWPGAADMRLSVSGGQWRGLDTGCGYLWGAEVEITSEGRGAASRPRRTRTWLGGPGPGPGRAGLAAPPLHALAPAVDPAAAPVEHPAAAPVERPRSGTVGHPFSGTPLAG